MKSGYFPLIEFFDNSSVEQFIVPEIQRDYVWGNSDVSDMLSYLSEGYDGNSSDTPYLGFIYAYSDRDSAYNLYLIDGQQRLTTLFLLLLSLYTKSQKKLPDYFYNRNFLKLDYKVRQSTHDVMLDLVDYCTKYSTDDLIIKDQLWFHKEYENDRSIRNIVGNFKFINDWIDQNLEDFTSFINYIENKVMLSYYSIEGERSGESASRQGEDLYLYMNSRGRHLEPNETLKAKYLNTLENKEKWGSEWEDWQDFFWKNRGNKLDADLGFNDFLKVVQIIEMSKNGVSAEKISQFSISDKEDATFEKLPSDIVSLKSYFDSYCWLLTNNSIRNFYKKYEKNEAFISVIPNANFRQIYYFKFLPILAFLSQTDFRNESAILKFVRLFYILAKKRNLGKDISTQLPNAIRLMVEYVSKGRDGNYDICDLIQFSKGRATILDIEVVNKLTILKNAVSNEERLEIESLFTHVEDNPILDGEVSFLLDKCYSNDIFNKPKFIKSWMVFNSIFGSERKHLSQVTIALAFYGNTWIRVTPLYYENYDCQNWTAIVNDVKMGDILYQLIEDLFDKELDFLDVIIKAKIKLFFEARELISISKLKLEKDYFSQLKILMALDYYSSKIIFRHYKYMARDERFLYSGGTFFENQSQPFNVHRYISDGNEGMIIEMLKGILKNDVVLNERLSLILNNN